MTPLESLYSPMGKMVVRFGSLESQLMFLVVLLTNAEVNLVMILVSEMSFSKRVDALSSIVKCTTNDPGVLGSLKNVITILSEAEAIRNRIIHSTWMPMGSDRIAVIKPSAKRAKGHQNGLRETSVNEIEDAVSTIETAANMLYKFALNLQDFGFLSGCFYKREVAASLKKKHARQ